MVVRSAEVAALAEGIGADVLLDDALLGVLGPVDPQIVGAIVGICNDALVTTLGPAIVDVIGADRRLVPLVAPWTADLVRGLLALASHGPGELRTTKLLCLYARHRLTEQERTRYGETIDLAATLTLLTLDRVVEHVLGPGACARNPGDNEAAAPWLPALEYGHRVHITLEFLRLLPAR